MPHIIVDGYNLIRQVSDLMKHEKVSLEAGRSALLQKLAAYRVAKGHKITVVFDGQGGLGEFAAAFRQGGLNVIFSTLGETADDVIKALVSRERSAAIVASSDRDITDHARRNMAGIISAPDFYARIVGIDGGDFSGKDSMSGPLHKRWITKKTGPSKKLPKKLRQNRIKTRDL
jgi:predicted RNA-binding protein with PIN domain